MSSVYTKLDLETLPERDVAKRKSDPIATAAEWCRSRPRHVRACVVLLLSVHAGLLAHASTRHSPTLNEPGHLVAGLSHWKFGRFELYRVNPPLVRMIAALPVLAAGYEEDWSGFSEFPGARPVFSMGLDFVEANGARSIWLFKIARWACLPISLIGGFFCFLWSRKLWGSDLAGLISLTLWCFEPIILAHGELITPDCAAASFGLGAGYSFWRWLRSPNWERALNAGALLGLAQLSKMTWVFLFGLWPLLWLFWPASGRLRSSNEQVLKSQCSLLRQIAQLATVLLVGVYVLNMGYGFNGSFQKLKDFTFISRTFTGLAESGKPGNRLTSTWLGALPVPVPRQYILGVDTQKHDLEDYGHLSYLRGEWKDGGWWYYYLYGVAVKTSHGTQLLLLLAVLTVASNGCRHHGYRSFRASDACTWQDVFVLVIPAVTVLVLVSSQLEFNHHVRYVLPVFGFMFVFIGGVGARSADCEVVPRRDRQAFMKFAAISVVLALGCGRESPGDRAAVRAVGDDAARSLALCARIDLGVLVQGEKTLRRQWVENRRGAAVRVGRIESSCECLTVDLAQSAVEPGARVLAEFRYDGSKEPDFVGSLMVEAEVWDRGRRESRET